MKFSVVTPCLNAERFIEETIQSVRIQREAGIDLQYIIVDGGSTDATLSIIDRYRGDIDQVIHGSDQGPAADINKGFAAADGEILAWLNADDFYSPGVLSRVADAFQGEDNPAVCFGHCLIVDGRGREIRRFISGFKEACFPWSSRFLIHTLNYISQPAMFFRSSAYRAAGPLRTDLKAAWDYDLLLRLWDEGAVKRISPPALAAFRWTPESISGRHFRQQFREEYEVAARRAGRFRLSIGLHAVFYRAIILSYLLMNRERANPRTRKAENGSLS